MSDENAQRREGGTRSIILQSDQEKGMALVQSKDGRTKWLTVSADPTHYLSWDERLRNWANKLGVGTQPVSPGSLATPLPTPPPHPPHSQGKHEWIIGPETFPESPQHADDALASAAPAPAAGASAPQGGRTGALSSGKTGGAKRNAGSFARGFLLGLAGSGGGSAASTSKRDSEAKVTPTDVVDCPPSSATSKDARAPGTCRAATKHPCPEVEEVPAPPSEPLRRPGRERWLKGAPSISELDSSCGESDEEALRDSHGFHHARGTLRGSNGRRRTQHAPNIGLPEASSLEGAAAAPERDPKELPGLSSSTSKDTARTSDGDGDVDDPMTWIDIGQRGPSAKTTTTTTCSTCSSSCSSTAPKRKKSKSKNKGKAKKNSAQTRASATLTAKPNKRSLRVSFGNVCIMEFTRDVGGCGVPGEGTWSLSLGLPFRETSVDVDGYELAKTETLDARLEALTKKQRQLATGETRQFDHRPTGVLNPLFTRLDEKERSKRLLDYACFHKDDLKGAEKEGVGVDSRVVKPAGAKSGSEFFAYPHKISHSAFVDKSREAGVELDSLRSSRRKSRGCSCACLRVDKLNVARLREELNRRGLKVSGSKKELARALQEAMQAQDEKDGGESRTLCRRLEEGCQCLMDGVECHADMCNCCKGPNVGKKDVHNGGACGNPEGVYAYSSSAVRAYRAPFVTAKPASWRDERRSRSNSVVNENQV